MVKRMSVDICENAKSAKEQSDPMPAIETTLVVGAVGGH